MNRAFYAPHKIARHPNRGQALEAVMLACTEAEKMAGQDKVGPLRAEAESLLEEAAIIDSFTDEEWTSVVRQRYWRPARNRNLR